MNLRVCAYVLVAGSLFAGAAYAAAGLWGDIDEAEEVQPTPKPNTKAPLSEAAPAKTAAPKAAPKVPDQKTTCELFKAQKTLTQEGLNAAAVKTAMQNNMQNLPVEYKAMFAKQGAMDELYKQYRDLYLKKYCL